MVLKWAIFIPGILLFSFSFLLWISDQAMIDRINLYLSQGSTISGQAAEAFETSKQNVVFTQIGMAVGSIIIILGAALNTKFFSRVFKIQKK